ncbi:MAG: GNAT family N-acetyltransferase [Chloroflexi bacterium]|nr:GNAT family N-acetyltransferase [Chloroflexota bacterium]MCL5275771.1 GNAT family N-acetyltransferase [Chloroflexota bacterium]
MVIRPFRPLDQPAARLLILEGLGEHFGYVNETLNPDLDDIERHYLQPGHIFLVAEDDSGLIGSGALMVLEQAVGRIVRVSVSLQHRRRGVGSAIVQQLLWIARQRSLRCVQVETNNDWHDAIRLYRSHGFVEYDRDDVSVYMELELP